MLWDKVPIPIIELLPCELYVFISLTIFIYIWGKALIELSCSLLFSFFFWVLFRNDCLISVRDGFESKRINNGNSQGQQLKKSTTTTTTTATRRNEKKREKKRRNGIAPEFAFFKEHGWLKSTHKIRRKLPFQRSTKYTIYRTEERKNELPLSWHKILWFIQAQRDEQQQRKWRKEVNK